MRVVVDLTRCQGYGQCVFAAPDVFAMPGQEALLYDPDPSDEQREHVLRAQAACPVQAIHVDRLAGHVPGPRPYPYPAPDSDPDRGDGFRRSGRVVIVGASLAGVRAAAVLRRDGFAGSLTLIGDEPHEPYDRPPLSKQVLTGRMPLEHTTLPRLMDLDAEWLLGQRATGLDVAGKRVRLADGREVEFDRLLIATGSRARPWPNEAEAALDGVCVLRTIEDATLLRRRLASGNGRVLVIGAGFTGSEVASVCRELGRPVTVVDRGPAPLAGALGKVLGGIAAQIQREHGVDLHCDTTVIGLDGDAEGGCAPRACPTAPPWRWRRRWSASARSATSTGWRARGWPPESGAWAATRAAASSTSTGW
ncbi:FAD-dependent oxidoreductase [Microtetraspora malaysiensis]|uniref:FAD-dependent oxidoreductase n=1 Tax=Microtetraspora malaysiensis TaxID=161358 RepID=UPI003D8CF213